MGCRGSVFYTGLVVLALAAAGMAHVSTRLFRSTRLLRTGGSATGVVVDRRVVRMGANNASVYPIVQFKSADGSERRFESRLSGHGTASLGDTVRVVYDRDSAEIGSFGTLFGPALIELAVVLLCVACPGALLIWFTRFGASAEDRVSPARPRWMPRWFPP